MAARHTLKIDPSIQAIINECIVAENVLVLKLPPRQLDRKVYADVKKVVEAAGGKWSTKHQGFLFETVAAREACQNAGQGGEIVRTKVVLQAFYTPAPLADRLVDLSGIFLQKTRARLPSPRGRR